MTGMTIAGLAREGDVGVEPIRYYQRRGLLDTPDRPINSGSGGGIRRYGPEDVRRLRFIRSAQGAGFTLEQIGESFGITRERVRQIKEKALLRLRHQSRARFLETFLS